MPKQKQKRDKFQELLDTTGLTKEQIYKTLLEQTKFKPKIVEKYFRTNTLRIGVVSDTHICSWYEYLDQLHTFYELCRRKKVKAIVHAGDMIDGIGIYRGQENEIHTFGAERQANYCVKYYPHIKGIKTYFIGGNHDHSFWKKAGIEVGKKISDKRSDMEYLGQDEADILINGVKIRLFHPTGGISYAKSYKGQKIVEKFASGSKPNILIIGHFHFSLYFFYRNIHILHPGCFQAQTPYMRAKGLNPDVGGWIITIHKVEDEILELEMSFVPFYQGSEK